MNKWDSLSMKERAELIKIGVQNGITNLQELRNYYNKFDDGGYVVKKGDSLWKIAHQNNLSLDELMSFNNQLKGNINTVIHPGDVINITPKERKYHYEYEDINSIEEREKELNKDDLSAIQSITHDNNYVVIDKKNRNLKIFDANNQELYNTNQIITGSSKQDYNTKTYTDERGILIDSKGNMSTPAGITVISGVGNYHGVPSFTRARINSDGKIRKIKNSKGDFINDDIASSLHYGVIYDNCKGSNGCIRIGGKQLQDMSKLVGKNTKVYTLPEQEGSRFEVRQGKLNYFADNPYGETEGEKKLWDDYNVYSDKSYNPLLISPKQYKEEDYEYNANVERYSVALMQGKNQIQKMFGLDSYTYDKLAQLAMGIAEQETKFNTSKRKKIKDITPDFVFNTIRGNSNRSRGATQIKIAGDNKGMQQVYKNLNINEDNIDDVFNSGLATIARLAYIYNTEVRGRHFKGQNNNSVSPYDALLYKWMGRNDELKNKTATPNKNIYIRNVKKYINNFDFESGKKVFDD